MVAGEYAVLFDYPALVGAVDCRATTTLQDAPHLQVKGLEDHPLSVVRAEDSLAFVGQHPNANTQLFTHALEHFFHDRPLPNILVETNTRRFFDAEGRKLGLGSSAAATVSLTAALLHYLKQARPSQNEIIKHALQIHKIKWRCGVRCRRGRIHRGRPHQVSTNCVQMRHLPHWQNPDWQFLIVFTGKTQSTKAWVKVVEDWASQAPKPSKLVLQEIHKATLAILAAMETKPGRSCGGNYPGPLGHGTSWAKPRSSISWPLQPPASTTWQWKWAGAPNPVAQGVEISVWPFCPSTKSGISVNSLEEKGFSVLQRDVFSEGCHPLASPKPHWINVPEWFILYVCLTKRMKAPPLNPLC